MKLLKVDMVTKVQSYNSFYCLKLYEIIQLTTVVKVCVCMLSYIFLYYR